MSLVLGIAGLFVLPLILSIAAIIVGKSAERKIAQSNGALAGSEMAKVGIVTGWIGVGLGILVLLAIIVLVAVGVSVTG